MNAAFEAAALRGKAPTIEQLADSLRSQNYDVRIRTALGGGGNQECLRNLRHHFLTLTLTGAPTQLMLVCSYLASVWASGQSYLAGALFHKKCSESTWVAASW